MTYFYRTESPSVLAAVRGWMAKRVTWDAQREKLGQAFGGAASPMYSGSRSYVGGIKLSHSRELDVHWCRPDDHGYRALRTSAKHVKGSDKNVRAAEKLEHQRLLDLWTEHCPQNIDRDEAWKEIGVDPGSIWLGGGVFFELDGVVYLSFGSESSASAVDGVTEILGSEYEAARREVTGRANSKRNAA
ncbi:hypothetical protein [Pseudomonas capsici]|uniref:hypothetical protein n=1 Tax=Pseudomonas capsici TaxID=2810614 RepID=UPI0021F1904E|nr:hypothetical protein [Pseudomonas capsici]MCV4344543.1 hypothetical protein [Pseudomonas capsici]